MRAHVAAFAAGCLFAAGLGLAGMTDARKVVAFLDFSASWDPALAFVMVGAIGTHALLRRFVLRRPEPLFGSSFPAQPSRGIDARLIGGAVVFGFGWGLGGFCPAPAIVDIGNGSLGAFVFAAAMLAGIGLHELQVGASARVEAAKNKVWTG